MHSTQDISALSYRAILKGNQLSSTELLHKERTYSRCQVLMTSFFTSFSVDFFSGTCLDAFLSMLFLKLSLTSSGKLLHFTFDLFQQLVVLKCLIILACLFMKEGLSQEVQVAILVPFNFEGLFLHQALSFSGRIDL